MTKNIKQLCFKYFSGKAEESDAARIREFIAESPDNAALFRLWEKEWKQSEIPTLPQVRAFKHIRSRILTRRLEKISYWIAPAAAAVALAFVLLHGVNSAQEATPAEPNIFTVETRYCEQTKVVLPDSTVVWLNAASRLSYSGDYTKDNRTVTLEGEGFFDVRHDPSHPFVVKMGDNDITVYGTKFNACAYPDEERIEAALLEGSIAFSNPTIRVEMQPGEILAYNISDEKLLKYTGDVQSRVSWLGGTLVYSAIDLSDLLDRISSIYGERITYQGNHTHTLSIILNIKETIPNILDAISYICPVKWEKTEAGGYIVETL